MNNFPSSSTTASSISSLSSFSSDDVSVKSSGNTIKFLYSYGGKILPRYPDGKLRYVGGDTRVLAVDRSIPFSEVLAKMGELCGWGEKVTLRCQLPTEDLDDALVSVTSDEDLANLVEEYDLASKDRASPLKIRAFLSPKHNSPPTPAAVSPGSSPNEKRPISPPDSHRQIPLGFPGRIAAGGGPCNHHRHHQNQHLLRAACAGQGGVGTPSSSCYRQPQHAFLVHNGNHWQ